MGFEANNRQVCFFTYWVIVDSLIWEVCGNTVVGPGILKCKWATVRGSFDEHQMNLRPSPVAAPSAITFNLKTAATNGGLFPIMTSAWCNVHQSPK